jgi:hydroxymethylglutaryl-CoA synthase
MADIKSIASFIPQNRLEIEELVTSYHSMSQLNYKVAFRVLKKTVDRFRGKALSSVRWVYNQRLMLREKVVPGPNEDALTAGIQSLNYAIRRAGIEPNQIDALFVVSESYPYAVKSSTAIAGKAGLTDLKYGVRGEFACKPFGEFLDIAAALIDSGRCRYVAVTATDASQGAPGDDLEFSASFYSTSIILGKENGIAEIKGRTSINYDFSDFIRKEGEEFPEHEGQGTSLAFRGMILSTLKKHIERYPDISPECLPGKTWVIHSPNGSFPNEALVDIGNYFGIPLAEKKFDEDGKMLGIEPIVNVSNLAPEIANGYSATVPTALCNAMETAEKGDEIMTVLYGSGAGSDVISIKLKANGSQVANNGVPTVQEQIDYKQKISVEDYFKFRDSPDQAAKHIALLEVDPVSKEYYVVEGCPKCGAVYFGDSWTKSNFPDFAPPEKFEKLEGRCLRGIQTKQSDAKRICGEKLQKLKIPKRARTKQVHFHGPSKKAKGAHPESPYWAMFDQKLVRGFNYNPRICNFSEGEEVKAVIGRWRPAPKGWVPILYVPMYTQLRRDYK